MKIPHSWLSEFVKLEINPNKIEKLLTMAGIEVDDLISENEDAIYEISLTPNLNHCASVLGIAREIAANINEKINYPSIKVEEGHDEEIQNITSVDVEDTVKCPRYACRLIRNVKVGPSPAWMQAKLEKSGIRPINNIVDVTNYVLLEMGHPMHAFDFDALEGQKIIVRSAKKGETIVTLDNKTHELTEEDLLICDNAKAVAIAGIMGGLNSEVTDKTRNVLLESAYFLPTAIRRTSKRLGLQSDSSRRFERGADPNGVLVALNRAAMLIEMISAGKTCRGFIDIKQQEFQTKKIKCRLSRANKLLGTHISMSEAESVFQRLGMEYTNEGSDILNVTIPTYRVDLNEEIDLIEEIARLFGFDNLSKSVGAYQASTLPHAPIFLFEREVRKRLLSEGLQEFVTCDLIGPRLLEIVKESVMAEEAYVRVLNPVSVEQSYLRTTLLPGLLQVAKNNFDHQIKEINGFEIGRIHFKQQDKYKEQSMAAILLTGKNRPEHWGVKAQEVDFYDLKGILENVLSGFGLKNLHFKKSSIKLFHPGRQASILIDSRNIGMLGEIHPSILRRLDFPQPIYFAEFDLHELIQLLPPSCKMSPLAIYPSSERDWTITLGSEYPIEKIFELINAIKSPILESVTLIDIYRSDKLGQGKQNATFHFVYRDQNRTIEHELVDAEHSRIINQVESQIGR